MVVSSADQGKLSRRRPSERIWRLVRGKEAGGWDFCEAGGRSGTRRHAQALGSMYGAVQTAAAEKTRAREKKSRAIRTMVRQELCKKDRERAGRS